jgi:hypothetical protein
VTRTYHCRSCGATWLNYPPGKAIEPVGRCLRCDGVTFLEIPSAEDPAGPRAEADADPREETDASPPVPNGLEDDAET